MQLQQNEVGGNKMYKTKQRAYEESLRVLSKGTSTPMRPVIVKHKGMKNPFNFKFEKVK